jgi:hypothetical protein
MLQSSGPIDVDLRARMSDERPHPDPRGSITRGDYGA